MLLPSSSLGVAAGDRIPVTPNATQLCEDATRPLSTPLWVGRAAGTWYLWGRQALFPLTVELPYITTLLKMQETETSVGK